MSESWHVIALSRHAVGDGGATVVQGDFTSSEDLRRLDEFNLDVVVHLASETGGCSEAAGLSVNVDGTRQLLRYLVDRGCERFVVASSIAAVGCLDPAYLPTHLPIGDDEPCRATDAYGLSKWLMEAVVAYFHRQYHRLDATLFRIGAVLDDATPPVDLPALDSYTLPITQLGSIAVGDVITAISLAASHEMTPDLRRANLVALNARTPIPTADAIARLLGARSSRLDLSYYEAIAHQYANVFAIDRLQEYFRFTPAIDVRTMKAGTSRSSDRRKDRGHE